MDKHIRKWCIYDGREVRYDGTGLEDQYVTQYLQEM